VLAGLLLFIPLHDLTAALRRVPAWVWPVSLTAYLLMHLIGIVKWRLLVNAGGAGLTFAQAARCYYYGLFGNLFLPSIVGGDVVRAGLALSMTRSVSGLFIGSIVDRTLDIVGLAGVAGIGALLLPTALDERSRAVFTGLGVVFLVASLVALLVARSVPARRLPYRLRRRIAPVRAAVRRMARQPGRMVSALLLGMLLQSLLTVMNAWLGDAVGIEISVVVWLFVWPLAKIAAVVPVTQGGIGVREAAIVALFQPFRVTAAQAMATGLVFEGVVILGGLLAGGIALLLGRLQARQAPAAR
jgi:uncharacterized protein (TIRG00374 family)